MIHLVSCTTDDDPHRSHGDITFMAKQFSEIII